MTVPAASVCMVGAGIDAGLCIGGLPIPVAIAVYAGTVLLAYGVRAKARDVRAGLRARVQTTSPVRPSNQITLRHQYPQKPGKTI
jgi:hypothetical protein